MTNDASIIAYTNFTFGIMELLKNKNATKIISRYNPERCEIGCVNKKVNYVRVGL